MLKVIEYDQEMPQSQTADQPITTRKRHRTLTAMWHKNTIKVKEPALSSSVMIEKNVYAYVSSGVRG